MNRCYLTVVLLGPSGPPFCPLAAADLPPAGDPSDVPLEVPVVRQAMQDRSFAEARKAIDEVAKAKDAPGDYLAYLRAWSLYLEKQHDQAIAALEKFEKDFPRRRGCVAPVCQGPGHGSQGRLPRRAGDLRTRGEIPALRSAAAAIGGRLSGVCRRKVPAPPRGSATRLQDREGVLCPGPGYRPGCGATCGG